jgi:hypothetical protein
LGTSGDKIVPLIRQIATAWQNKEKGNNEAIGSDSCKEIKGANDTQFRHCGLPSPTLAEKALISSTDHIERHDITLPISNDTSDKSLP